MEEQLQLDELREILRIRREKLAGLCENGQNPFELTRFEKTHSAQQILQDSERLMSQPVSVAGRIMSRRIMGKASFAHILDESGQIQLYFKADVLQDRYEDFKKTLDIGDIIGVSGQVFVTHKGEVSIAVEQYTLLSKSLQPLPEKFHGLRDDELRYRQRYVDLIMNPEVRKGFVMRSKILAYMREYLQSQGFLEVETPVLNTVAGGATARPFITHHNTLDLTMYMRIAPELYLKELVVGGLEKVFEMGRVFRNEGMDSRHNPEFTILELYQAYADCRDMMEMVENVYYYVVQRLGLEDTVSYQGTPINLKPPYTRISMMDAVKQFAGIDFDKLTVNEAQKVLKEKNVHTDAKTWGGLLYAAFDKLVEDKLVQPTFVYDYPIEESPLAKKKKGDHRFADRFEFFVYGREMANAYSELNDPIDQKQRFVEQAKKRDAGDQEALMTDDDFINALEYGLPPTGGLGFGVDRFVMLLCDAPSIRDVILFPTMKPKK